jgi:NAD(P)-dependent dehydrogenase (short-subunit alcohol dehydrogenase family)
VTGGAAGIGRAIAKRLAAEGAAVVVADVDEEWGAEAVAEIRDSGGAAAFARTDVRSEEEIRRTLELAEAEFGGLDVLVNNAFEATAHQFPEASVEEWSSVLTVSLWAPMLAIQLALEPMARRRGGSILNISSVAGLGPQPHSYVEYATAKAAVIRLTQCLAPLAAERNVRVNCLAPDWTATEFVRERFAAMTPEERAEARDGFGRPAPDRLLEPDEVAAAAVELIADDELAGRVMVLWCGEEPRLL